MQRVYLSLQIQNEELLRLAFVEAVCLNEIIPQRNSLVNVKLALANRKAIDLLDEEYNFLMALSWA